MSVWLEAKKRRLPLNHIFLRGWQVINGEPQLQNRQKDLEINVEGLQKSLNYYKQKLFELQEVQNKLGGGK